MVTEKYSLENLCCPNCAGKIEEQVNLLPEVKKCHLDFLTKVLTVETVQGREIEHNKKYCKIHRAGYSGETT
jgi:cation transport ATPase